MTLAIVQQRQRLEQMHPAYPWEGVAAREALYLAATSGLPQAFIEGDGPIERLCRVFGIYLELEGREKKR